MAENTIYVSGNPELYPVEYYDDAKDAFAGAIPQLLEDFAEKNGYNILYYEADGKDRREHHFENSQVDAVSGVGGEYHPEGQTVTVFETEQGGREVSYGITFTQAAPEKFKEDLAKYLDGVSESEKTGLLVAAGAEGHQSGTVSKGAAGVILVLGILVLALGVLLYRSRRRVRRNEQKLVEDRATGLGNKEYLENYYRQLVNDQNRAMYCMYYFHTDTKRLQKLSGQQEAEAAMRYAGKIVAEYAGEADIPARISENGIVLLKLTGRDRDPAAWIHSAIERIRAYARQYDKDYDMNVWVGAYSLKKTDRNLEEIIVNARQSAHMARRENVDFRFCSEELLGRFREQRVLEGDIERAFQNGEFQMYIQFYADTQDGNVTGAEALTRWQHPAKGLLAPGAFLPILEQTGDIERLDFLILERACTFLERNFGKEGGNFFLSCNFSRTSFVAPDFVQKCKNIIDKYEFDRGLLLFELTESPDTGDTAQIRENARKLTAYGIKLALDDFGEGYTSFRDLLNYPITTLKLDKILTDSVTSGKGCRIVRSIIETGHALSVKCLAEGVESEEVLQRLKELSCDAVQGYMFYYPLPEPEAEDILAEKWKPLQI